MENSKRCTNGVRFRDSQAEKVGVLNTHMYKYLKEAGYYSLVERALIEIEQTAWYAGGFIACE